MRTPESGFARVVAMAGSRVTAGVLISAAVASLAGCAKMDTALGQTWVVVQFAPNTTIATARHVATACSHVPNLQLAPIKPTTAQPGIVDSVRYNSTNATVANMAQLQVCLQRFPVFQGMTQAEPGDNG